VDILIKSKEREVPIDSPDYDGYRESVEYVKKYGDQMKFETEAERRDYERLVKSNPQNVMGMPAFFPPLKLRSVFSFDDSYTQDMIAKGYWKHCEKCGKLINANHYEHNCEETDDNDKGI
jgi:hypothetical protein